MAVVEFIRPSSIESVDLTGERPIAMSSTTTGRSEITELYHLLPDASADLGRTVLISGTVIGEPSAQGFWVRDLRDNIVFISGQAPSNTGQPRRGQAVRVRGSITLFPKSEQGTEFSAAGLVLPPGAVVIREIRVTALDGGIELLRD